MRRLVEVKGITHKVLKNDDVEKYLSKRQKKQLEKIEAAIYTGRLNDSKKYNNYIVCNEDEPYANDVLTTILQGELNKD